MYAGPCCLYVSDTNRQSESVRDLSLYGLHLSNVKILLERNIAALLELRVSDQDLGLVKSLCLEATG